MKFVILGDCHLGARNDLSIFYGHFDKFYDTLIQYMVDNGIDTLIQLGDLFDRRKYINFRTLQVSRDILFDRLERNGITLHVLIGNHDAHLRESVEINSPELLLSDYHNILTYSKPATITLGNTSIDMIPWICKQNESEVFNFIKQSKSDLCMGHFEIAGFTMYRGMESIEGLSVDMFERYEAVYSGHYHTRSQKNNITYTGTPYEMTWQDYNDPKGFYVFDTETRITEFVQNTENIFKRIDYDDREPLPDIDSLKIKDCFVKLVVVNKTDLYKFDNYIQQVYNKGAFEVKILEDFTEFSGGEIDEEIDLEDTLDVLNDYIDSLEVDTDKTKIKSFMKSLYLDALHQEID